jgi:hypothetical protein
VSPGASVQVATGALNAIALSPANTAISELHPAFAI